MEPTPFCVLCLRRSSPLSNLSSSSSTEDVASLCTLLSLTGKAGGSSAESSIIYEQQDGNFLCSLCSNCSELIQEMKQIQQQISQLQNHIGKRALLLRNIILKSDGKRKCEKILGWELEEMVKLRSTRDLLLRLSGSGQEDNAVVSTEVEVKLEPEDYFDDDPLLEDQSCSPSTFLLHPDVEDDEELIFKNEEDHHLTKTKEEHDSESSFSTTPKRRHYNKGKWSRTTLRRSERRKSASLESGVKPKQKLAPPKKKRKLIHKSDAQSDDDYDADPDYNIKNEQEEESEKKDGKNFSKPLKCSHCSMRFSTQDAVAHHIQQYHRVPCLYCHKRFRLRTELETHHLSEHKDIPLFLCTLCKRRFKRNCLLVEHMIIRHETVDKAFFCDKCGKGFTLELNYKRHLDLHKDEDKKPLVCEVCDTRFPNQARLDRHSAHHSGHGRYACQICSQRCSNPASLARHMRIHTGEKPVKCDHCDEKFIDSGRKKYHVAKMHSSPDEHHLCPVCGKSYFDENNLKLHIERHEGILKVVCDECGEKFSAKATMRSHKIEKHGADPIICDECGAKFKTKKGLANHKMSISHSTGERPHKCETCGARFFRKEILKQHMRKHSSARPYPCPHCESKFKNKKNLGTHVKKIHTEGYEPSRPHECSYPGCGRKFEYKSFLDNHFLQTHSMERPFVCEVCNKGFAARSALTLHKKSTHGISTNVSGDRQPRSKPQFPSKSGTIGRRKRNPRPGDSSCSSSNSDSNSEPPLSTPTQFPSRDAIINPSIPASSFYNPPFANYFPL